MGDTAPAPAPAVDDADKHAREPRNWSHETWLAAYAEHGTVTAASKVCGISRETAYQHRRANPDFAAEWDKLENAVTEILEKTAVQRAIDGSDRLMEFMLKARRPGVYREHVKIDGTVNVEVNEKVDAQLESALADVDRLTERLADVADRGQAQVPREGAGAPVAPAGQPGPAAPAG